MQRRYGIDVNSTGADALTRAPRARSDADTERTQAIAARTDDRLVGATIAGANRQDRSTQRARAEPAYDSPERRQQLAESLEGQGDREAVNSRLLADKHQGTHPSAAVAQNPSLTRTSKRAKQGGKGKTLERRLER